MNAEIAKDKHDEVKAKNHAKAIHTSIEKAEKKHQILKAKTIVKIAIKSFRSCLLISCLNVLVKRY